MYMLSDEHEMLKSNIRKLATEKIAERAKDIDKTGEYPWDILELFRNNSLMGIIIPEEFGGEGSDLLSFCIVIEEIARVCCSSSLIIAAQTLATLPILIGGNDQQKKKYLPGLARGETLGTFCLTEPEAGSDPSATKTIASKKGNQYVLNGTKCFITNGGIASVNIVFATVDPSKGYRGISAFIVDSDSTGFSVGKIEDKMGIRGSQTTELVFEDCLVPEENLLGREGDGFSIAMATLERSRPSVAAQGVGIAQGALDIAISYAKQRKQFGKPISELQGIQFMIAEMSMKVEAARNILYRAASVIQSSLDKNGVLTSDASKLSSIAKVFASDTAMSVTTDAVQILGGYGYMKDYPVERMMRDAKITQIYEGTNQIQKLIIARNLFRE